MKPTKEIIELAKQLYEKGYRQKFKNGNWEIWIKFDGNTGESKEKVVLNHPDIKRNGGVYEVDMECAYSRTDIPIPSLDDGLKWLKEHAVQGEPSVSAYDDDKWECCYHYDFDEAEPRVIKADTPHETVLKAMIKVLELRREG